MIIIPGKLQATDATHITAPFTDIMDNIEQVNLYFTKNLEIKAQLYTSKIYCCF